MRSYTVKRASGKVPLSEQVAGTAWSEAESLSIDNYPWFKSGRKEATTVRLLYDEKSLYVQFLCADDAIYAERTEINSSVCTDSCVEFFAMPAPELDDRYFNLEINCAGTFLLGWGRNVQEILAGLVDPEVSRKYLKIATSVEGPKKEESPQDNGWWVTVAIPFEFISQVSGREVQPSSGTTWRANFYRCGGKTNQQHACWNRIDTPRPDFHRPEFFGQLLFQ